MAVFGQKNFRKIPGDFCSRINPGDFVEPPGILKLPHPSVNPDSPKSNVIILYGFYFIIHIIYVTFATLILQK